MICRLCLQCITERCAKYPFETSGCKPDTALIEIIEKYLHLKLTTCDGVSAVVCAECTLHLEEFHKFCLYVKKQQCNLRNETVRMKDIDEDETAVCSEANVEVLINIKDEPNAVSDERRMEESVDREAYAKDSVAASERESCVAGDNRSENTNTQDSETQEEVCKILGNPERKLDDLDMNEFIAKHMQLKCGVCETPVLNFCELRDHAKREHNRRGFVVCCERRFSSRLTIFHHVKWHLDASMFECKVCQKQLKCQFSLFVHMMTKHSTDGAALRHACPMCGKRFLYESLLKAHSLVHQSERNFACMRCDKAFHTQRLLDKHIKGIHENFWPHVCDICGRSYKFKPAFQQHVAAHQGVVEQPQKCDICGQWLKNKHTLRVHMERHQEGGVEIKCKYCNRVVKSERSLREHIRRVHETKSFFNCHLCDKAFKIKKNLEEHITTHTGEKKHKCPFCPREATKKSNMYVHIKNVHRKEWQQKMNEKYMEPSE